MIEKDRLPFDVGFFADALLDSIVLLKSPKELSIKRVSHGYANNFVLNHHYLKRKIYIARNVSYGLFLAEQCVGVAMFGFPVWTTYPNLSPPLQVSECPELVRLCTIDGLPKNTSSYFLSGVIKLMHSDWKEECGSVPKCITSFCDTAFGFSGGIYRATNFTKFRETDGRATNPGKSHGKWKKNTHEQKAKKIFYVYYYDRKIKCQAFPNP
jgi:hypothetical protein